MTSGRMWILAAAIALTPAFAKASAGKPALGFTSGPAYAKASAGKLEASQAKPKPKVVSIVIDKATFGETPAGIAIGDTIEWVNMDIFDHTSTSKAGGWDVVIPAGKKARVVMKKAGAFDYLCKYHPNMTGVVRVGKR